MKAIAIAVFFAFTAVLLRAQSPTSVQAPDVAVIKSNWSKERIGWQKDPFGGPLENFDEMRARARNEKRIDDAKRGGGAEVDRIRGEARVDASIIEKTRQKGPPRYQFLYKCSVVNNGMKTIKAVDWDYIFFNVDSQSEAGRLELTSEEKIGPGKTKELNVMTSKPPAKTVSVYALDKKERQGLDGQVVIMRIEYTDGSVWQRP